MIRVWFKPGSVEVQTVAFDHANDISDRDYLKPGTLLYAHNGPSDIPAVEDFYFIYALLERDEFYNPGPFDTDLAIIANGMFHLGHSRTEIMNRLESTHSGREGGTSLISLEEEIRSAPFGSTCARRTWKRRWHRGGRSAKRP